MNNYVQCVGESGEPPVAPVHISSFAVNFRHCHKGMTRNLGCMRTAVLVGFQAAGLWERALEVAEEHDGINLSTTHHLYAQHLEKASDGTGRNEGRGWVVMVLGFCMENVV